jgi:hypothetical protein
LSFSFFSFFSFFGFSFAPVLAEPEAAEPEVPFVADATPANPNTNAPTLKTVTTRFFIVHLDSK